MDGLRRMLGLLLPIVAAGCLRGSTADDRAPAPSTTQKVAAKVAQLGLTANPSPDASAVRLEVRPLESTGAPGSRCLVIATVTDSAGQPRRQKKIEWSLDGVGSIAAVDTGSYLTVLERKPQDKFAVSYTGALARTIKGEAGEDVPLAPGQSWCILTSDVEGESRLTVHAPEIADARARETFVRRNWADVAWTVPPVVVARLGESPAITVPVVRASDRQATDGYRVRYRIVDGPPAYLMPNRDQQVEVAANGGAARISIVQPAPRPGRNRLAIELLRSNPAAPESDGQVVARSESAVDWQSPQVTLRIEAPLAAVAGQEFTVNYVVTNSGSLIASDLALRCPIASGTSIIRSAPEARDDGGRLLWPLANLPPGESRVIQTTYKAAGPGVIEFLAAVQGRDGLALQERTTTRVAVAQLLVELKAPPTAAPGDVVTLDATITNAGSGRATDVVVQAAFDDGLEHASGAHPLEVRLGALEPGQSRSVPLALTPRRPGVFRVRLTASAAGNLTGEALHTLSVAGKQLSVHLSGPATRYAGRTGVWEVRVSNPGSVPLTNVQARVQFPGELECRAAGDRGQFSAREAVWPVGTLRPSEERKFQATAAAVALTPQGQVLAAAAADGVPEQKSIAPVEVLGVPALRAEIVPPTAATPVGSRPIYRVVVRNTGTLAARKVVINATMTTATIQPLAATGPTIGRVAGDRVDFEPLERLDARQTATFLIEAKAVQVGDARLRITVATDDGAPPIEVEESTVIVPPPEKPQGGGSR